MKKQRIVGLALIALGVILSASMLLYPMTPEIVAPEGLAVVPPEVDVGIDPAPVALTGGIIALLTWAVRRFSPPAWLETPRYLFGVSAGLSIAISAGQMALGGVPLKQAAVTAFFAWCSAQGLRKTKKLGPLDLAKRA